ncbi:hypothetical protein QYZ42_25780 [Vibrio parahaemolyticus]|nr:hypothetical protein [Vibrio parahaemolyticus]
MFKLKGYQQRAVDVMQSFLSHCLSSDSVEDAYKLALEEQELPHMPIVITVSRKYRIFVCVSQRVVVKPFLVRTLLMSPHAIT